MRSLVRELFEQCCKCFMIAFTLYLAGGFKMLGTINRLF